MNPLAGFSDWVLALLPRLFLVPGGVCLLIAIGLHYLAAGNLRRTALRTLLRAFLKENTLALATAWVAVALIPFAGIAPLLFPVDTFALLALPIASLAFDQFGSSERNPLEIGGVLVITISIMALVLPERHLLITVSEGSTTIWPALVIIAAGLVVLAASAANSVSGAMRWLALGSLGLTIGSSLDPVLGAGLLALVFAAGLVLVRLGWGKGE